MSDTVIAPRYQMRYEQLVNTHVLDRIPYFHDREIEYILEVSKAEAELAKLKAPVSNEEWAKHGSTYDHISICARIDVDALIAARAGQKGK